MKCPRCKDGPLSNPMLAHPEALVCERCGYRTTLGSELVRDAIWLSTYEYACWACLPPPDEMPQGAGLG